MQDPDRTYRSGIGKGELHREEAVSGVTGGRILWNGKKYDSSQILAEAIVLEAKGKLARE